MYEVDFKLNPTRNTLKYTLSANNETLNSKSAFPRAERHQACDGLCQTQQLQLPFPYSAHRQMTTGGGHASHGGRGPYQ